MVVSRFCFLVTLKHSRMLEERTLHTFSTIYVLCLQNAFQTLYFVLTKKNGDPCAGVGSVTIISPLQITNWLLEIFFFDIQGQQRNHSRWEWRGGEMNPKFHSFLSDFWNKLFLIFLTTYSWKFLHKKMFSLSTVTVTYENMRLPVRLLIHLNLTCSGFLGFQSEAWFKRSVEGKKTVDYTMLHECGNLLNC